MKIQLRELIDKSMKMVEEFYTSFSLFEDLIQQLQKDDVERKKANKVSLKTSYKPLHFDQISTEPEKQ